MELHLLSTDQEMIRARNAVDARIPNFVLNGELLYYPYWKHLHSAPADYTLLEMLDVFSLCVE